MDEFEELEISQHVEDNNFEFLTEADYTPLKGWGTAGGWMMENYREAHSKDDNFKFDSVGKMKLPKISDTDIDFFDPSGMVGMTAKTGVKFTYSAIEALKKMGMKTVLSKEQLISKLNNTKNIQVPPTQIEMMGLTGNMPDRTVGSWIDYLDALGDFKVTSRTRLKSDEYSSILMPESNRDSYGINIQSMNTQAIPTKMDAALPANHWDDFENVGHSRYTTEEIEGWGTVRMLQEYQSDFGQTTRKLGSRDIHESQMKTNYDALVAKAEAKSTSLRDEYGDMLYVYEDEKYVAEVSITKARKAALDAKRIEISKSEAHIERLDSMNTRQHGAKAAIEYGPAKKSYEEAKKSYDEIFSNFREELKQNKDYKRLTNESRDLAKKIDDIWENDAPGMIDQAEELNRLDAQLEVIEKQRYEIQNNNSYAEAFDIAKIKVNTRREDLIALEGHRREGNLVKDFPINDKKFRQYQIMNELDMAMKDGINTIAIPIERGPSTGLAGTEEVTAAYKRDVPKDLEVIRKKLTAQGHTVTIKKQDYTKLSDEYTPEEKLKSEEIRNNMRHVREEYKAINTLEQDRPSKREYELSTSINRLVSYPDSLQSPRILHDAQKKAKEYAEARGYEANLYIEQLEWIEDNLIGRVAKPKKINEIYIMKVEQAKDKPIDWTIWGVGGAAVGLGVSQESGGL